MKRGFCGWIVVAMIWSWSAVAWANPACYGLFRQKRYQAAAECFQRAANEMGAGSSLSREKRVQKGRLLRNAALSWNRAATGGDAAKRAWMRERAVKLLGLYDREGLYESGAVRSATNQLRRTLEGQIGYASVGIVTNNPKAMVTLKGFRFDKSQVGMVLNLNLRPGKYSLEVSYPGGSKREQSFSVAPFERKTLVLNAPSSATQVTIVSNSNEATIQLEGGNLGNSAIFRGALWTRKLDPGQYTVKVTYPGQQPEVKSFSIESGQSLAFVFNPPGPPTLRVTTQPDGASVFVDGQYRGKTDLRIELKEGSHEVILRRTCYLVAKRSVSVAVNQEKRIALAMTRDPAFLKWRESQKGVRGRQIFGWSMLGAGLLVGGLAGAMHGVASAKHTEALEVRQTNFPAYQSLAREGNTFRTVGHISIGVGGAALIAGVVGLVLAQPSPLSEVPCKVRLKDE
ncbi:MAG: PEGA domain-containing protein [Myxococcales bacterium]|nr:PEGA domain-containing protein [Myxococcales bacterium]